MKRKIRRNIFSIIIIAFSLVNLSGCEVFVEQGKGSNGESVLELHGGVHVKHGRNPDIESEFERYEKNNSFVKDSVGYSDNITYQKCEEGYKIEGDRILWGDHTLCEMDLESSGTIFLKGEVHVEKGNYKLLSINQDDIVEVLVEDEESFDKEISLNKGLNKIKIVGKPVTFQSLNLIIDMNRLKKENIKSLIVLQEQVSLADENIAQETEIEDIIEEEESSSIPAIVKNDQPSANDENIAQESIEIKQGTDSEKQDEIEEGRFSSLSYLKMGNTLLSGTGIHLNGKKILVELNLSEEKELELDIDYKKKNGKCSLVLIENNGEETVIEDVISKGKKTIPLNSGKNTLILDGEKASFLSIQIGSNVEDLWNE